MRSRLGELGVATLLLLTIFVYISGHCSYLDAAGTVSGCWPTAYPLSSNRTVLVMPGTGYALTHKTHISYFIRLWFVAYHPIGVVIALFCCLTLLRHFREADRRPLFMIVNQVSVAVAIAVVAEILYFVLVFTKVERDGAMLTFLTAALVLLSASVAGSFYLLAIAHRPSLDTVKDGSPELRS